MTWNLCIDNDIKHYIDLEFNNWGDNVSNVPLITFVPKSKNDIVKIIKWSRLHGKRVRCSGYRHTWNEMYSENNEVLIAMIPLEQSDILSEDVKIDKSNDLLNIEMIKKPTKKSKGLVRIGASVNNETFRKWAIINNIAIPMNVIMVEITFGGSNTLICHGAGIENETLSDIVYAIEIIDCNGLIKTFNRDDNSQEMEALSGSFGLFGVITSLTLEVDCVSYAIMDPKHSLLEISIPRNENDNAFYIFKNNILNSYYNEYFWFPPSDKLWVNCWNNNGNAVHAEEYPSNMETNIQEMSSIVAEVISKTMFKLLPDKIQQKIFSFMVMKSLPNNEQTTMHLMNGLHFRRGIHNMRVRDYELEIPIPANPNNLLEPDLLFVSKLWWQAVDLIKLYESKGKYPIRIAIEMRIMAGSSRVLMAPQRNNQWTCTIEVLTSMNVSTNEWIDFVNHLNDIWLANKEIKDMENQGLYCRPHWAKEWTSMRFGTYSALEYIKKVYKNEINQFIKIHDTLGMDSIHMFSNPLFDNIFGFIHNPDGNKSIKFKKKTCNLL